MDHMFQQQDPNRFRSAKGRRSECLELMSKGKLVTGTSDLLNCFRSHLSVLGKSTQGCNQAVSNACHNLGRLDALSIQKEELIFDAAITVDELNFAIKRLKRGRSPGHDNLESEQIRYAGEVRKQVLTQILNAILNLEEIPPSLKFGVITPL